MEFKVAEAIAEEIIGHTNYKDSTKNWDETDHHFDYFKFAHRVSIFANDKYVAVYRGWSLNNDPVGEFDLRDPDCIEKAKEAVRSIHGRRNR